MRSLPLLPSLSLLVLSSVCFTIGEFCYSLVVEEDKNLSKNASISLLKKKYERKKSLTIFSAINGVVFFFPHSNTSNGKNKNPRRKLRGATPRITTDRS